MKRIKTFGDYRNLKNGKKDVKESVQVIGNDVFRVQTVTDVTMAQVKKYIANVKASDGVDLSISYAPMQLAELLASHLVRTGFDDVSQIPASAIIGGAAPSQGQAQTLPQGQTQAQMQGQPQAQPAQMQAQVQPQAQMQPQAQVQAPQGQVQGQAQPQAQPQSQGGDAFEEPQAQGQAQAQNDEEEDELPL